MSNKVVLITGASAGMGEATAIHLKNAGYIVYGAARRVERMDHLKKQGILVLKMDVTDDESMVQGVGTIIKEHGRIDVLVNNAGYGSYGALEDVPLSEAKYQFDVNVFGMARLIQLILPHMRKQKYGKIVNISSGGGKIYTPMGTWYHATKHAVEAMSDCLRFEVKNFGIDVIIVEPGAVKTEWEGVAMEHLKKTSGNTAYKDLTRKVTMLFTQLSSGAASPDLIAKVIEKSIKVRKPKQDMLYVVELNKLYF